MRPIRFHDLRHTTGSLLFQTGANPAAVQRILRHSDPRITTETYGHLTPGYLREEVDRLRFGMPGSEQNRSPKQPVAVANAEPFAAYVLQEPIDDDQKAIRAPPQPLQIPALAAARPAGLDARSALADARDEARVRRGSPSLRDGAPGRTRTCDPRLRRPLLYPTELRALTWDFKDLRPMTSSTTGHGNQVDVEASYLTPIGPEMTFSKSSMLGGLAT